MSARVPLPRFRHVARNPNLADQVAESILNTIRSERLQPGQKLPSERELADHLGVSRTVIREATRSLAGRGIVEIRSGSGVRVAAVDPATISQALGHLIRSGGFEIDYDMIHAVRFVIEVEVAGLACATASDSEIQLLGDTCEQGASVVNNAEAFSQADVAFHRTVAQLTHNELFVIMLDSIGDLLLEIRRALAAQPEAIRRAVGFHRQIHQSISARDPVGARAAMREHLEYVQHLWQGIPRASEQGAAEHELGLRQRG